MIIKRNIVNTVHWRNSGPGQAGAGHDVTSGPSQSGPGPFGPQLRKSGYATDFVAGNKHKFCATVWVGLGPNGSSFGLGWVGLGRKKVTHLRLCRRHPNSSQNGDVTKANSPRLLRNSACRSEEPPTHSNRLFPREQLRATPNVRLFQGLPR